MMLDPTASPLSGKVCRYMARTHGLAYAEITPDLIIVEASSNLKDMVTPDAQDIVGQRLTNLFWEFVGAEEALYAVLQGESSSYRLEWVNFVLPNGRTTYLTFEVIALHANEPSNGLLLVIEDATEHATLEQVVMQERNELRLTQERLAAANADLQRLLQFKSLMLSLASSEFRTPLTTIRLYAGLLLNQPAQAAPQDRQRFITTIYGQANRLDALVNDLLDLDLIEAGRLKINRAPCDLGQIVRQAIEIMNAVVLPRRLNWSVDLPEQSLAVSGDVEHLRRIVHNLLNHAVKYGAEGSPIEIDGRIEGDDLTLEIVNRGPGMTGEELTQLFQPYYLSSTSLHKAPAADMGLFVVKYLVEAHNGQLVVTSQAGQGTTFTVRLPLQDHPA